MSSQIDWDAMLRMVTEDDAQADPLKVAVADAKAEQAARKVREVTGVKSREEEEKVAEDFLSQDDGTRRLMLSKESYRDALLEDVFGPIGKEVAKQKRLQQARDLAREQLAAEKVGDTWKPPLSLGIASFLADEPEAPSYHVDGLWPHGGLVLLNASKKWGKTTNVRHTVECMLTGQPLYRQFAVTSPVRRALVIDNELSHRQAFDMWRGTSLTDEQLTLWRLRECLSTLAIRNETVRAELTQRIAETGAELLVIDPLGPLLRANEWDENSNTDVGRALDLIAEMAADAGVTCVLIPHHTGHDGAHARGASVIGDKADAIWSGTLAKHTDPYGIRKFGAIGRSGVSLKPVELSWDETTRTPYLSDDALSNPEEIAGRAFDEIRPLVKAARAAGITTVSGVRQYVRDMGVKARQDVIDEVHREVKEAEE